MPATIPQNNCGSLQAVQLAESERIFVTKIPRDCTEAQLRAYFQKFGNVTDVHMPTVPGKPGHKGIAFVSYDCPKVAEAVRTRQERHSLLNRNIIVDFATTRNPELSAQRKAATQEARRAGRKDGMDEYYEYMMGSSSSWKQGSSQSWQQPQQRPQRPQGGYQYEENATANGSSSYSGSYSSEHYSPGTTMQSQGGPTTVAATAPTDLHTLQQEKELFEYMYGASTASSSGDTTILDGAAGDGDRNRVFVSRIPQDISQQEIEEYFSQFGPLADCYMPGPADESRDGHSAQRRPHKGIAFLTFQDARVAADVLTRSQSRGSSYEVKPGQFVGVAKAHDRASTNSVGGWWGQGRQAALPMSEFNRNGDAKGGAARSSNYRASSPY